MSGANARVENSLKYLSVTAAFLVAVGYFLFWGNEIRIVSSESTNEGVQARYTKFSHDLAAHKVDCASCHRFPSENWKSVRPMAAAFPDITEYPDHNSCINCHRQQFFRGARPAICTICHVEPGPRNSKRHPFPNPREIFDNSPKGRNAESEFAINFPHEIHVGIVSRRQGGGEIIDASWLKSRPDEQSCSVCHQTYQPQGDSDEEYAAKPPAGLGDGFWLKKGTFKTSPIGHSTCFTCHSADTGIEPAPTNCAACHQLKQAGPMPDLEPELWAKTGLSDRIIRDAWRSRHSSGTFRHEFSSHAEMDCSSCHNVTAIKTTDPRSTKVNITSCNYCHITGTTDDGGILNFEIDARRENPSFQCVKCHLTYGKSPIPDSHIKAIAALAGN